MARCPIYGAAMDWVRLGQLQPQLCRNCAEPRESEPGTVALVPTQTQAGAERRFERCTLAR